MGMKNLRQKYEVNTLNLPGRLLLVVLMATGLVACGSAENSEIAVPVPIRSVVVNVPGAQVTPAYTLNGGAFDPSENNDGNFVLRSTTSAGDMLMLGASHDASPAAVMVIPDTYDVLFQHETGNGVPQNVDTRVQADETVNSDRNLSINVLAWEITPSFTQNDSLFPVSEYDGGEFYLRPAPGAGGERILIGNSHRVLPDPVQVMQGTYDVIYSLETGGNLVPNNQGAVVMTDVLVNADRPLNVNVRSVSFEFDASLDTGSFPSVHYQEALFFLRNVSTGDRVELGASFELPVTLRVVEGVYDIVYQHIQGDDLPVNTDAVVASKVIVDDTNLFVTVNVESVAITPSFTLDGEAFPQDEYNDANFYLRAVNNNNDVMFLGASGVVPTAVRVIDSDMDIDPGENELLLGAYDVLYRHESGTGVPRNANAVVPEKNSMVLNGNQVLTVPVTSISVTGHFTLNGNGFPGDINNSVRFLLRNSGNNSDEFLFGFSDISNEAVRLIPGTYHVVIDHFDGDDVPQNKMHDVAFNEEFNEDQTLNINIPVVRIDPAFTLNGQAFPASIYQSATFYLRDTHSEARIFLGRSYKKNSPVMVIEEDHEIIYEHLSGDQVPQNTNNNLGTIDL